MCSLPQSHTGGAPWAGHLQPRVRGDHGAGSKTGKHEGVAEASEDRP